MKRSSLHPSTSRYGREETVLLRRQEIVDGLLINGFPYSRTLNAHRSCINSLTLSRDDEGRFLASGGDDTDIYLWDFRDDDLKQPSRCFLGPRANIFALAFSAGNKYLVCGNVDRSIQVYDVHTATLFTNSPEKAPFLERFNYHNDSVREVSCHPFNGELFLSCSEDGRIIRHDLRERSSLTGLARAQDTLQIPAEITCVRFHPRMEHIFATSEGGKGRICLRDMRMTFGSSKERVNGGIVLDYDLTISTQMEPSLSRPEPSSLVWDEDGTRLAVTLQHFYPTIYAASDPHPIAICSDRSTPPNASWPLSRDRPYSNSCTIKHGSFGGSGSGTSNLYAGGSDNFQAYVWKLPSTEELVGRRQEVSSSDWESHQYLGAVGFLDGTTRRAFRDTRYIPVDISEPFSRLKGHSSIVTTALIHPQQVHILTAGIEKNIVLHSPTPSSPCTQDLARTTADVRVLPRPDEDVSPADGFRIWGSEYPTILLFDDILRQEGGANVFAIRRWKDEDSSDDEDEDADASDDDEPLF